MIEVGLYIVLGALSILFRYNLGLTQACRTIGVELSNSGSDTGFQDALTPPSSTNITLITWVAIAGALGYLWYEFGWGAFGIGLGVLVVVSAIAGATFIPKPNSVHFQKKIYSSLANRYADFMKSGDSVRADATKQLVTMMEEKYPSVSA